MAAVACMACMAGLVGAACVNVCVRRVDLRFADMGRHEFTTAMEAAIDDALLDRLSGDRCFVVVNGRAAGDTVHVGMMNAWQR